jgi:hypothetical protein
MCQSAIARPVSSVAATHVFRSGEKLAGTSLRTEGTLLLTERGAPASAGPATQALAPGAVRSTSWTSTVFIMRRSVPLLDAEVRCTRAGSAQPCEASRPATRHGSAPRSPADPAAADIGRPRVRSLSAWSLVRAQRAASAGRPRGPIPEATRWAAMMAREAHGTSLGSELSVMASSAERAPDAAVPPDASSAAGDKKKPCG